MRIIHISKGLLMLVDEVDYDYMSQWLWSANPCRCTTYAVRNLSGRLLSAHIAVAQQMGIYDPSLEVDHIDGCGLNNTRGNLQMLTHADNGRKQRLSRKNTSGYRGVGWDKSRNKWKAYIRVGGRMVKQSRHGTLEEAIAARAAMEKMFWQSDNTLETAKRSV